MRFARLIKPKLLPGHFDRFPVVQTLDLCKDVLVSFDEVSELVQQARAFESCDIFSPGSAECAAGGCNGDVDVLLGPLSMIAGARK